MAASAAFSLDGVPFRLSEDLKPKPKICLPPNLNRKDIKFLLHKYDYDFSLEKHVVFQDEARKNKEVMLKEREQEITKLQLEKKSNDDQVQKSHQTKNSNAASNFSSVILTPEKYTRSQSHNSPQHKRLDVNEFVEENLDPFSNAELQTIDDFKELKDVLQIVTMGGMPGTSKPTPHVRHHTPTSEINEDVQHNTSPISSCDLENNLNAVHSSPELYRKVTSSISVQETTSSASSFPIASGSTSSPTISPHEKASSSQSNLPSIKESFESSSAFPDKSNTKLSLENQNRLYQNVTISSTAATSSTLQTPSASKPSSVPERNYVNVSDLRRPQPLPRSNRPNHIKDKDVSSNGNVSEPKSNGLNSSAVQNKVLASKSKEEKAKFEATINKALTSLPTLPFPVVKPKVSISGTTNGKNKVTNSTANETKPNKNLLKVLNENERKFAEPIIAMGFKEEDVVRAVQKSGTDHKDVLDYLIKVQCLSDKGFARKNIDDALDLFQGNVEETAKYLTLEQQFLDMGFPKSKVREALILHNIDQNKALEELMGNVK